MRNKCLILGLSRIMIEKVIATFIILLCVNFNLSVGQTRKLTIDSCYLLLNSQNINLKVADYGIRISKEDIQVSKNDFIPNLDFDFGYTKRMGLVFDQVSGQLITDNQWTSSSNSGITASLLVFDGFKRRNSINRTKFILERAELEKVSVRRFKQQDIAKLFFEALIFNNLISFYNEKIKISTEHLIKEKLLFNNGQRNNIPITCTKRNYF